MTNAQAERKAVLAQANGRLAKSYWELGEQVDGQFYLAVERVVRGRTRWTMTSYATLDAANAAFTPDGRN